MSERLVMEFMKILKSRGRESSPCGTPEVTGIGSDVIPSGATLCCLSVR